MTGLELFDKYTARRDYSGSEADEYAQLLRTILGNIGDAIFPLLEKAEKEKKQLSLKDADVEEFSAQDIILL